MREKLYSLSTTLSQQTVCEAQFVPLTPTTFVHHTTEFSSLIYLQGMIRKSTHSNGRASNTDVDVDAAKYYTEQTEEG